MKTIRLAGLLTLAFGLTATSLHAQTYPNKPIKAIVPFAAGSATDQIGRAFVQKMSEQLGQPIVIENKAGVNGMLGADAVAKSCLLYTSDAPDDYSLV
jgi:tripartite-type tricarboxylate transporter receptor subunit TctC